MKIGAVILYNEQFKNVVHFKTMLDRTIDSLNINGVYDLKVIDSVKEYDKEYFSDCDALLYITKPCVIYSLYESDKSYVNFGGGITFYYGVPAEFYEVSDIDDSMDIMTVETPEEICLLSDHIKQDNVYRLIKSGVSVISPDSTFVCDDVEIESGTVLLPNVIIRGNTVIGKNCEIGPNTLITDCTIGDGCVINSSQLVESEIKNNVKIGPFAYIRPNCVIENNVKIGDFVEIKKSSIGEGTKVAHLTYVGDAEVGRNVNFGCGTVVVNYNGAEKTKTVIGDNAFIGCNTNLISPVKVGDKAYTAAGSTITTDVPGGALAVARAHQRNIENWVNEKSPMARKNNT